MGRINSVRSTASILIKQLKDKERILKEAGVRWLLTCQESPVSFKCSNLRYPLGSSDLLAETMEARRWWDDTVKVLKEKTIIQELAKFLSMCTALGIHVVS